MGLCNKGDLLTGGISKVREKLRESAPWEPSKDSVSKRKDGSTPSNALRLRIKLCIWPTGHDLAKNRHSAVVGVLV